MRQSFIIYLHIYILLNNNESESKQFSETAVEDSPIILITANFRSTLVKLNHLEEGCKRA
jgi:hypothetical protein